MNTVTRGHLAGLELVQQRMAKCLTPDGYGALCRLIAQAGAAPEQEPVAWGAFYFGGKKHGQLYNHSDTKDEIEQYIIQVERRDDSISLTSGPLYTHPSAEIERLRAENKRLDLALAQADHNYDCDRQKFEQKLAEAQALLLRCGADSQLWYEEFGEPSDGGYQAAFVEIDAFLSATAQPAEVKS